MQGSLADIGDIASSRAVYGVLLNFKGELDALGNAVNEPPYKAPPRAPVLYVKPANTWIGEGEPIRLPEGEASIEPGVSVGIVFGRSATRVSEREALDFVRGYAIVNDVRLPHSSFYRPAIKQLCRDSFCVIGSQVVARQGADLNLLKLRAYVNGTLKQEVSTATLVRAVPRLIAEVSEFMTLGVDDILMIGVPAGRPAAKAGDRVRVEVDGIGSIENPVSAAVGAGAPV